MVLTISPLDIYKIYAKYKPKTVSRIRPANYLNPFLSLKNKVEEAIHKQDLLNIKLSFYKKKTDSKLLPSIPKIKKNVCPKGKTFNPKTNRCKKRKKVVIKVPSL